MTRSRPVGLRAAAGVVTLVALAAAGCGGDDSTSTAAARPAGARTATVSVAGSGLGKILVDSRGQTLYLFEKDKGSNSTCSGGCATAWPPLKASGTPTAGSGAKASLVSTTRRSDGTSQVTYDGHPLYGYQGDSKAGDTNGQGITAFGGTWYVLSASGAAVTMASLGSGGTNGY